MCVWFGSGCFVAFWSVVGGVGASIFTGYFRDGRRRVALAHIKPGAQIRMGGRKRMAAMWEEEQQGGGSWKNVEDEKKRSAEYQMNLSRSSDINLKVPKQVDPSQVGHWYDDRTLHSTNRLGSSWRPHVRLKTSLVLDNKTLYDYFYVLIGLVRYERYEKLKTKRKMCTCPSEMTLINEYIIK